MEQVTPETVISAQGLGKNFAGREVLRAASLSLPSGSITALTGPSGAGKTTLLRILAGLDIPDCGSVRIGQILATEGATRYLAPHQRGIGMVFQQPALWPHMTVRAHIGFGLAGQDPVRDEARVEEVLGLTGLTDLAEARPGVLSGGEAARVALARALAPEPACLLLDEPLAHLQVQARHDLLAILEEAARATNAATLIVTHMPEDLAGIMDRHLHLEGGVLRITET